MFGSHAFILFSDIVQFTAYCSRREPRDVVVMLNSLFATFDNLLAKHNVYKVTRPGQTLAIHPLHMSRARGSVRCS